MRLLLRVLWRNGQYEGGIGVVNVLEFIWYSSLFQYVYDEMVFNHNTLSTL